MIAEDRPRVYVKVVTLNAEGWRRGYEDEIVLEPGASYGDFLAWVDESIDRAIDDPEGRRWQHEEAVALAITRYADKKTADAMKAGRE
jgi:hypothetical protein